MITLLKILIQITWALWFGGVMGLFLSVQVLFHQTDRAVFLASAPRLFLAFEKYQILLAVTSLVLTLTWCATARTRRLTWLLTLFAIAALGAVVEATTITPRIEALRIAGETHTPQFLRLHGLSMCVYMGVAITLLAAGILQALDSAAKPAHRSARNQSARALAAEAQHRSMDLPSR
jgi:hypothetical protein